MRPGRARAFLPRRRGFLIATALAVALAAAAVATATNYQTYTDPGGDNNGAPDVTTVHVSNDPAGNLTFEITLAGAPDLTGAEVDVNLDTDQNAATGQTDNNVGGIENGIWVFQGRIVVARWTGTDWTTAIPQPANANYTYANGVLAFTVAPTDVGVTNGFNFWIGSYGAAENTFDPAPEFGLWNYQVVAGAPKLVFAGIAVTKATAGKQFVVLMKVTRADSGAAVTTGNVVCKAAIAGVGAVKGTGGFVKDAAGCVFKIPKNAKGKTIKGTITVGFQGATLSKPFSAKIK